MVLVGKQAADCVTNLLLGLTIHRRTLVAFGFNVDLHLRVCERDVDTSAFTRSFMDQLGVELSTLPSHVYDELVTVLLRNITGLNQQAALKNIFCHQYPDDVASYSAFVSTDFFQLLRHYMSKHILGFKI